MTELTYTKVGDYLLPNLVLDEETDISIGRYGRLRETFLQEQHPGLYTSMLLTGRLTPYLQEIDRQAQEQVEQIVGRLMEQNGVNERLKAKDQIAWVRAVNSFIACAEESALAEVIYR